MFCLTVNVFPPTVCSPYSVSLENYSHLNSASVSLAFVFQGILTVRKKFWSQDSRSSKHKCFDRVNGSVYQSWTGVEPLKRLARLTHALFPTYLLSLQ